MLRTLLLALPFLCIGCGAPAEADKPGGKPDDKPAEKTVDKPAEKADAFDPNDIDRTLRWFAKASLDLAERRDNAVAEKEWLAGVEKVAVGKRVRWRGEVLAVNLSKDGQASARLRDGHATIGEREIRIDYDDGPEAALSVPVPHGVATKLRPGSKIIFRATIKGVSATGLQGSATLYLEVREPAFDAVVAH